MWRPLNSNSTKANTSYNQPTKRVMSPAKIPPYSPSSCVSDPNDNLPTPKANAYASLTSPMFAESVATPNAVKAQYASHRISTNSSDTIFEEEAEVDDLSEDDNTEILILHCSDSIRRNLNKVKPRGQRPASLVIPSPGAWPQATRPQAVQPQVAKLRKSGDVAMLPMMTPTTPLSPAALAKLAASHLRVPLAQSNTPSLDGSITTDDPTTESSPSTPDLRLKEHRTEDWEMPIQLHPEAMDTLFMLSADNLPPEPEVEPQEMQERGLSISIVIPNDQNVGDEDLVSAISIPSPGGFFSSLSSASAQQMWGTSSTVEVPNTGFATQFYGVSWRDRHSQVLEDVPELREEEESRRSSSRLDTALTTDVEVDEIKLDDRVFEYDEDYEKKLHETANSNMSRTSMWISAQTSYLAVLDETNPLNASQPAESKTPDQSPLVDGKDEPTFTSPSKKSVRFVEAETKTPTTAIHANHPPRTDSLFYQAFQHLSNWSRKRDSIVQCSARAEALQTQRLYLPERHRAYIMGHFKVVEPKEAKPDMFHNKQAHEDPDAQKRRADIVRADKERQALQQLSMSFWSVEATRILNGGVLLPKVATEHILALEQQGATPRILDLDGHPLADLGWALALHHRRAKVYTAIPTASLAHKTDWTAHRGPSNHRATSVPNTWTLPFPADSFDVVSARSLHTLLRTSSSPTRDGRDEYDATLAELNRVLAPGGVLHFSLLEAEVATPSPGALSQLSIEFAVALHAAGYDPCGTRHFVPRLERAGFEDVQRAWVSLPLGGREAEGAEAATGLLGAVGWERWLVKLQLEMGRAEEKVLENVAAALEEARREVGEGRGTAGWRLLMGCARKAYGEI